MRSHLSGSLLIWCRRVFPGKKPQELCLLIKSICFTHKMTWLTRVILAKVDFPLTSGWGTYFFHRKLGAAIDLQPSTLECWKRCLRGSLFCRCWLRKPWRWHANIHLATPSFDCYPLHLTSCLFWGTKYQQFNLERYAVQLSKRFTTLLGTCLGTCLETHRCLKGNIPGGSHWIQWTDQRCYHEHVVASEIKA